MPEEYRRHEACLLFHWSEQDYDNATALMVDWAFELEALKAQYAQGGDDA